MERDITQMRSLKFKINLGIIIFSLVMTIFSLVMFNYAWVETVKTANFIDSSARAQGVVTGFKKVRSFNESSDYYYKPIVAYTDQRGNNVTFTDPGNNFNTFYAGEKNVEIIYQPDNPQAARINKLWCLWFMPIMKAAIGACLFLFGPLLFFAKLKMILAEGRKAAKARDMENDFTALEKKRP